jgi:hypothetical protein
VKQKPPQPTHFVCSACADEGQDQPQPKTSFYYKRKKRPDGSMRIERSYLCKRHTNAQNTAAHKRRIDSASPDYDAAYHAKVKAWKAAYAHAKLDPASPDYDAALHERQKAAKRTWARNHKPKAL